MKSDSLAESFEDDLSGVAPTSQTWLAFDRAARALEARYANLMVRAPDLSRSLVSFQANKSRAVYRWYKFREAFSADLVEYLLEKYAIRDGRLLDPFAGSGTSLFSASAAGMEAEGIELLPIGQRIIQTKSRVEQGLDRRQIDRIECWLSDRPWQKSGKRRAIPELRITAGAYSAETLEGMERYLGALEAEDMAVQDLLLFALLCVLETVSFTRKDGQYLRWDRRSGRRQGISHFDKGPIPSFDEAISGKLRQIADDILCPAAGGLFTRDTAKGTIKLLRGSCLSLLPHRAADSYAGIITSPPYCNRYDYTRTYALELALLGITEKQLVEMRQDMLSCTVENRAKDLLTINPAWTTALEVAEQQDVLQALLAYLDEQKKLDALNNNGIPRMIKGYFYEMACVIFECARVLKVGAPMIMVNDNVRYAGAGIPVDLILSDFAEQLGFKTEAILVLPQGKGNSSQQMGTHGRIPLRKCVYVWRKI